MFGIWYLMEKLETLCSLKIHFLEFNFFDANLNILQLNKIKFFSLTETFFSGLIVYNLNASCNSLVQNHKLHKSS